MQYRKMGKWGLKLSCLGLGSFLTIGYKTDQETSRLLVRRAYEAGINFIDTANGYNRGGAEEALRPLLAEYPRSDLVVLTKVWAPMGPGPNDRGLSAKHIKEQCDASLKRLGMDYVDIYMCHRPDPDTPLEETIRAMDDLARAGKILYWAASEWPATLMLEANAIAKEMGALPISCSEPRYNLLFRYPEQNLFDTTIQLGIGNVTFSPLAHGLLTGKYEPGQEAPSGTRAADPDQNAVMMGMYWSEENKRKGKKLQSIASAMGTTAATLSLAWCLRHPAVTSVILGCSKLSQLEENLQAAELELGDDVLAALDELYPPPPPVPAA